MTTTGQPESDTGVSTPWSRDEQFRRFVETSDDLMTVVDTEGSFLYVNPASERVFGLRPEECVGRSAWEFIHEDDRERTTKAFEGWLEAGSSKSFTFENRQVSRNGDVRDMLWTVTRQEDERGRLYCLASTARDVTAIRGFERDLVAGQVRLKSILVGMLDPLVTIDAMGTIHDANDSVRKVLGYAPAELIGKNIKLLMPEPFHSEHDGYLARYRETGQTWILGRTREFPVLRKDGRIIEVELSVSRIDVPGKEEPLFCGSFRDVTSRKAAERALEDSERRFRAIFDGEYQFVGLLSPDGTLLEANNTALEAMGEKREDVVGRPFPELRWWSLPEAREQLEHGMRRASQGEFVRFETENIGRDGALLTVDFSIKPIADEDGNVVLLIPEGRDITDIKRAQQRETAMMRAFAEIGESASLLAHEIKNPITAVNTALRAVAKQLGEDEQEILTDLVERMQKLEKLMRRTLSLARPLELHPTECRPEELIDSSLRHMQPHLEEAGIGFEKSAAPDCASITVDRQLVEDVLTNLVRNAIEALGSGGRIRLEARPDESLGVLISVDDDGPGIPERVLATLFKPFVSTKANGTGLGLAIARKVVEAHGGTIEAHNSPLGGARFELRFP